MKQLNQPETKKYVIDHNGVDEFTLAPVNQGESYSTEKEYLEVFDSLEEAKTRYIELTNNTKFLDRMV